MCGQPRADNTGWTLRLRGWFTSKERSAQKPVVGGPCCRFLHRTCSASHLSNWRQQWRICAKSLQVFIHPKLGGNHYAWGKSHHPEGSNQAGRKGLWWSWWDHQGSHKDFWAINFFSVVWLHVPLIHLLWRNSPS